MEKKFAKGTPVYRHDAAYAREHDELPLYRESYQANIACKEAIEKAIADNYGNNRLNSQAVMETLSAESSMCWLIPYSIRIGTGVSAAPIGSGRRLYRSFRIPIHGAETGTATSWLIRHTPDWSICSLPISERNWRKPLWRKSRLS